MNTPPPPLRFAKPAEFRLVHEMLCAAVDEALGNVPAFAAAEKARFSEAYLRALNHADPGYVLIVESKDGTPAGFVVSTPEHGVVILNWTYFKPEYRNGAFALRVSRTYARFWNNRSFHKIVFYAGAGKANITALGERTGYRKVADLQAQFYGQDFVMYELPLNKAEPGYVPMVAVGFRGRVVSRLRRLLGR